MLAGRPCVTHLPQPSDALHPAPTMQASLEEQSKQRERQLSRHLSNAAPDLAVRLRQQRSEAVRCSPEGVTFFQAADPAEGGGDCGLVLPSFSGYPASVRAAVLGQLCNSYLQNEAEQVGWQGARTNAPVRCCGQIASCCGSKLEAHAASLQCT